MITTELFLSGTVRNFGPGGTAFIISLLAASLLAVRWAPAGAAALATVALGLLGLATIYVAQVWDVGGSWIAYGLLTVSSHTIELWAYAQGALFVLLAALLAPRTILPLLRRGLATFADVQLALRVKQLTETRTVAVDSASAELRQLERDLCGGAQVQLVALGMSLRAAEQLVPDSPQAALALISEAKQASVRALSDLRNLVRGIYPPVLADRGLAEAIRALALDAPVQTSTDLQLAGRAEAQVEAACYFAVAEALTNAVKHADARKIDISARHNSGLLRITVIDDGSGGADPGKGLGLAGLERRLAAFDGILAVSSPPGGPTIVAIEVPCALSSEKISSC
jgi:signal transduction histidine kinase